MKCNNIQGLSNGKWDNTIEDETLNKGLAFY